MDIVQFFIQNGAPEAAGVALAMASKFSIGKKIPVHKTKDISYTYGKEANLGAFGRRIINQNFGETQGSTVISVTEPMAILGRPTSTDNRLDKADPLTRPSEHARAARAIAIEADDLIFNGNRSKSKMDIDGLVARCKGDQLVSAGTNGGQLTLDLFNDLIDAVEDVGAGRDVYLNKTLQRKFKSLVLAEAGGASLADVSADVFTYEGVRINPVGKGLDGKSLLDFDETQGSSNVAASVYCIAPGPESVEMSGVRMILASNSIEIIENGYEGSMRVDQVEFAFGLAIYDLSAAARLSGVLAPT